MQTTYYSLARLLCYKAGTEVVTERTIKVKEV